jgi:Fe-S cluster assembly protein SufD
MLEPRSRIDHHLARFAERAGERAAEPAFVRGAREEAIARFAERGFPTRKDEAWRHTSVEAIASRPFRAMAPHRDGLTRERVAGLAPAGPGAARLVFVNGRFEAGLSSLEGLPAGARAGSLAAALAHPAVEAHLFRHADAAGQAFVALNSALWNDGAFLHLRPGTVIEEPIQILHLAAGPGEDGVADVRSLIVAEEESRLRVVETWVGGEGSVYWTNAVAEVACGPGAVVDLTKVQREGSGASHVAALQFHLDRGAALSARSISFGGALVRNDVNVVLDAEGAACTLDGLYLLTGRQHEDNHTLIDHARPRTSSRELYKGVLDGSSRGVFHGAVVVRPDAQKADARQTNKNLLLSDEALVDTKPQLEIFADDVKCSHGATVGQIEESELFYLRSRGLDGAEARGLLIHAFAAEVLDRVPIPALRAGLEAELARRLPFFRAEGGR